MVEFQGLEPLTKPAHTDPELHLIGDSIAPPSLTPLSIGTASLGTSPYPAREDHRHGLPAEITIAGGIVTIAGQLNVGYLNATTITGGTISSGSSLTAATFVTAGSYLEVTGAQDASGNLRFSATNPYISASSYIIIPNGLYCSAATPSYFQGRLNARGGIGSDTTRLIINAGSDGFMQISETNGTVWASSNTIADGTYPRVMRRAADGILFYATSKRVTKERIKPITPKSDLIDALTPVEFYQVRIPNNTDEEYEWIKQERHFGFIAEDVNAVDPYLAQLSIDKNGVLEAVGWREPDIVAICVAEIQDLRKRIKVLERRP